MEARRFVEPLFWLHGTESKDRLQFFVGKVAEGHNGGFCAESRPHNDWLGPKWFSDLDICLQAAKKNNLKMRIFDEKWWPSQTVGGSVPPEYAAKRLGATVTPVEGPDRFSQEGFDDKNLVAVIAGKVLAEGIDSQSLVKLTPVNGKITWDIPARKWQVMKFTWALAPNSGQSGQTTVDGASKDCVDWFLKTVYQPHFDRFKADMGKTITGFFYDEPETQGDWGTELARIFEERGVDEKKALVAWKFNLAGDDQVAAKYAYVDALAEAWGRTMYGGMSKLCESYGTTSIGHFMDHDGMYLQMGYGATNIFDMQKHSAMGGMDVVWNQQIPGGRNKTIYQLPKMASSISHAYNKPDQLAMVETFGAYGQKITYPQMKWIADWEQLRGVNYLIPHSFNPKAPNDNDCPPYFYADNAEPRWPLYRIWADYSNRLSLMLTGGKHVCPIAFLFCGNSVHVANAVTPEDMTTTIQDATYDCDWLPYEVFEVKTAISNKSISLYGERYQVLIVPPVGAIPYATLAKAKDFFDKGGIVIGYDSLPSKSATLGHSSSEVASITGSIWGNAERGLKVCKTNSNGGRSYFLPQSVTAEELQKILADAGVPPGLQVVEGKTDHWLHVLHRFKAGSDIFLVCNQNHEGEARQFRMRFRAKGEPERWDAMRNEISAIAYKRINSGEIECNLTLQPSESALIVFKGKSVAGPMPGAAKASIPVVVSGRPVTERPLGFDGCWWVWYPEDNPNQCPPPEARWFEKSIVLDQRKIKSARFLLSADDGFTLYVNGVQAAVGNGGDIRMNPPVVEIARLLKSGDNKFSIEGRNAGNDPNPAGIIGKLVVEFATGPQMVERIDASWMASKDSKTWQPARLESKFGDSMWSDVQNPMVKGDPFNGRCVLKAKPFKAYLVMDGVTEGASVKINGKFAGGMIGAPYRLNVTSLIKPGANTVEIEPFAPRTVRLLTY